MLAWNQKIYELLTCPSEKMSSGSKNRAIFSKISNGRDVSVWDGVDKAAGVRNGLLSKKKRHRDGTLCPLEPEMLSNETSDMAGRYVGR